MTELPIPASEAVYGHVVGRFVRYTSDTPQSDDDKPDIVACVGSVKFTPAEKLDKATNYSAFVVRDTIHAVIDEYGYLARYATVGLAPGVPLRTGHYRVAVELDSGSIPSFDIEVTVEHTEIEPLDLVTASP